MVEPVAFDPKAAERHGAEHDGGDQALIVPGQLVTDREQQTGVDEHQHSVDRSDDLHPDRLIGAVLPHHRHHEDQVARRFDQGRGASPLKHATSRQR